MRKKTNLIIMGMVIILTLALVLTGCGKKNDTKADDNHIVSTGEIELSSFNLDSFAGTVWISATRDDPMGNHGRVDFLNDSELFIVAIDGQTDDYSIVEKDEYVFEDGALKVNKDSSITAIEFDDKNSMVISFKNGFKITFYYVEGESILPEDTINWRLEDFANNKQSQNQNDSATDDGELANTVWLGTKNDVMFEYRLEIVSGTELYMLRMQDGNTVAIEKGSYSFDGSNLSINGISMIDTVSYDADANRITIKTANDGLLFNFRITNETVMSNATLSALIDSSGGKHGSNAGDNSNKPTQDSDGKYVYNVSGVEVHASVNIWDYIDGNTFDLYKMLRDNGFELEFWHCKVTGNGSETTVDGFPHYANASNGDRIFFNSPTQRNPNKAPKNSSGLAAMTGIGQSSCEVTFEISKSDTEESTYAVSGTEIGMSIDQAVIVAVMIDGVNDGGNFDWYGNIFDSWKAGTRVYLIP